MTEKWYPVFNTCYACGCEEMVCMGVLGDLVWWRCPTCGFEDCEKEEDESD